VGRAGPQVLTHFDGSTKNGPSRVGPPLANGLDTVTRPASGRVDGLGRHFFLIFF